MSHVTLKEVLKYTRKEKYGIPCLAGSTLEMIIGIIKAAEECRSPIIICYNHQLSPDIPIEIAMPLLVSFAEKSRMPVATILDHGSDFKLIIKSMYYGSSSIMFDGSGLPFDKNVESTQEIVKIAHSLGISVEAELGAVGGSVVETSYNRESIESIYTKPDEVSEFVKKTNIDALAISFGNTHGRYQGEPKIDLNLVKNIALLTEVPLVMHGASGLEFNQYKLIVESGISKINYFSAMCSNMYKKMKIFLENSGEDSFCINTIPMSIQFWYVETRKLLEVLNCKSKANNFFKSFNESNESMNNLMEVISETVYKRLKFNN